MLFPSENRFVHARCAPKVFYVYELRQQIEKPVLVSTRPQQTLLGSLKISQYTKGQSLWYLCTEYSPASWGSHLPNGATNPWVAKNLEPNTFLHLVTWPWQAGIFLEMSLSCTKTQVTQHIGSKIRKLLLRQMESHGKILAAVATQLQLLATDILKVRFMISGLISIL